MGASSTWISKRVSYKMFAFGASGMGGKPVAQRVNCASFRNSANGTSVAVVGRFSDGKFTERLTTTDGGALTVLADAELVQDVQGVAVNGFVEVMGIKEDELTLRASTVLSLGEKMDVELWDQAVQMMHQPPLRSMFEPSAASVP